MSCTKILYRAFTDLCYAREFSDIGRFRIGRLDQYRYIENTSRVDRTEGLGHYVDDRGINEHFEFGNPIYTLCCSDANVDLAFLRRKMGPFVVKINDPTKLATDITNFFMQQNIKIFGAVKCKSVKYTRGSIINEELNEMARAELSVAQKHSCFSDEKENRLFAILNNNCPRQLMATHIVIDLGMRLPYVEVLSENYA